MCLYLCGDCMDYLPLYPDNYFDMAVVDPPYFSGPEKRGYYGRRVSSIGVQRVYEPAPEWDVPGRDYFDELMRVSRHQIIWGCNYFDYHFGSGRIIWDKCNGASSLIAYCEAEVQFTAFEKDQHMYELSVERFKTETNRFLLKGG